MIDHGTYAGYQAHKTRGHRGVQICDDCRQAGNAYMREYTRKRYDPARRRAAYQRAKARGYYDKE